MIVLTTPEPTVRPPSRFDGNEIRFLWVAFCGVWYLYYLIFGRLFVVVQNFRTIVEP